MGALHASRHYENELCGSAMRVWEISWGSGGNYTGLTLYCRIVSLVVLKRVNYRLALLV